MFCSHMTYPDRAGSAFEKKIRFNKIIPILVIQMQQTGKFSIIGVDVFARICMISKAPATKIGTHLKAP